MIARLGRLLLACLIASALGAPLRADPQFAPGSGVTSFMGRRGPIVLGPNDLPNVPASKLPGPTGSTLGGVRAGTAPAHQFFNGLGADGGLTFGQVQFSDVYGDLANSLLTPQGGTQGALGALLGDLSGLLYYVPTISAKVTLANLFDVPISPRWWGAKCDGTTDDTAALTTWANLTATTPGYYRVPAGNCIFKSTLTINAIPGVQFGGAGAYASKLTYAGASTTVDLLVIGGSATVGGTGYFHGNGFQVQSQTRMTAGTGIHTKNVSFVNLRDTVANGQNGNGNLWNGYWFDGTGFNIFDGYDGSGVQHDGVMVSGPGVGAGTMPQYDFWADHGKIGGVGACGWHVGGGFDGAHIDKTEITSNKYNVCIDNAIVAQRNQEVFIGPQTNIDQATNTNIVINDTKCADDAFYCQIDIRAQVTNAVGSGIQVLAMPNGHLSVCGPSVSWNHNAGLDIEDTSVQVVLCPNTLVMHNTAFGIYAGANYTKLMAPGRGNVFGNGTNFSSILGSGVDTAPGNAATSLTPGASPWAWAATAAGTLYVSGGTVSSIVQARPNSPSIPTGITNGPVAVRAGDSVTITYSTTPAVTFVPN